MNPKNDARAVEAEPATTSRITPNGSSPAASPILAAPASEQGEREAFDGLSAKLWCDLRTDEERSAWLLLGRGHETGVVAQALQNDLAMAYHRLALLSASLRASTPSADIAKIEQEALGNAALLHLGKIKQAYRLFRAQGKTEEDFDRYAWDTMAEAIRYAVKLTAREVRDPVWPYVAATPPAVSAVKVCPIHDAACVEVPSGLRCQGCTGQPAVSAEALDMLALMFDAYEDGPACYEDPEECAGYLGQALKLDHTAFHRIADLLNKHRPRAAMGTPPADNKENGNG